MAMSPRHGAGLGSPTPPRRPWSCWITGSRGSTSTPSTSRGRRVRSSAPSASTRAAARLCAPSGERRPAVGPGASLLELRAEPEQGRLVAHPSDRLDPDGHSVPGPREGERGGRLPGEVEEGAEGRYLATAREEGRQRVPV